MTEPHDRPRLDELLRAVRDFLAQDVVAGAEGTLRFHARVAANVLAIVERELALGPDQARAHAERLRALGFDSDAELARAIRAGELDGRLGEVTAAIRDAVRDKLAVANPKHLENETSP
jgi:hypothetical protein